VHAGDFQRRLLLLLFYFLILYLLNVTICKHSTLLSADVSLAAVPEELRLLIAPAASSMHA
jgi:hypothetical protein